METSQPGRYDDALPSYASRPFAFEMIIKTEEELAWFEQNWKIPFFCIATYLLTLYCLVIWMKDRRRFEMKHIFLLWNLGLAIFSLFGSIRLVPELVKILSEENGFHRSVCDLKTDSPVTYFWYYWFLLSKVVELGDTVFLVLRKRPLTFLHVYHHSSVLLVSWYVIGQDTPAGRWFVTMNLLVHSIMYTYYGLQLTRWCRVPRPLAMSITILQISQMVTGVAVNLHAFNVKHRGQTCDHSDGAMRASFALYFSYVLLFVNFFVHAYISKGPKAKSG